MGDRHELGRGRTRRVAAVIHWLAILAAILLPLVARAQVITVDTQDAAPTNWAGTAGQPWYLRTVVMRGPDPFDFSGRRVDWTIRHVDTEALIHSSTGVIYNGNEVIFQWTPPYAGTYYSRAQIIKADDGTLIASLLDDTLAVTSAPSAAISASFSNEVNLGNLTVQWAIQGDGDLAPDGTDRTISPASDLGAALGRTNERYTEAHVRDGFFETIQAGTVEVSTAIGFLDTTKVRLVGETNSVLLTNTSVQARTPTNDNEVATKAYADTLAGGSSPYEWSGLSIQPTNGANSVNTNIWNVIAGGASNVMDGASTYSFIGGGLSSTNRGSYAVIGGGQQNLIFAGVQRATIGGGMLNRILSGDYGVIAGGGDSSIGTANVISGGTYNAVAGGNGNAVALSVPNASFQQQNAIAGGALGYVGGLRSFVAGGGGNHATGNVAFAAGHYARAGSGMFVWADFRSTSSDPFGQQLPTNSVGFRARNWMWLQTDPGEATNLWGVLALKVITNSTPTRFLPTIPHRQGVYDAGSNILWIATGTTTNDYRGAEFALTP